MDCLTIVRREKAGKILETVDPSLAECCVDDLVEAGCGDDYVDHVDFPVEANVPFRHFRLNHYRKSQIDFRWTQKTGLHPES